MDPIVKKLATSWERAFQNRLPKAFATFISDSGKILHKFHEAVETRARENGVGLASLSTLKTQIYTYEMLFGELNQVLVSNMTDQQREANLSAQERHPCSNNAFLSGRMHTGR